MVRAVVTAWDGSDGWAKLLPSGRRVKLVLSQFRDNRTALRLLPGHPVKIAEVKNGVAQKVGRVAGRPSGVKPRKYRLKGASRIAHTAGAPEPEHGQREFRIFTPAEMERLALAADAPVLLLCEARSGNGTRAQARAACLARFRCWIGTGGENRRPGRP